MKKIRITLIALVSLALAFTLFLFLKPKDKENVQEIIEVTVGPISSEVRINGSVSPRNRLELKPQISGRLDEILVVEGQKVSKGQVLAWMSSSDRAALLDTVRLNGTEALKEWEDIYKPTPIVSPLDGFVIARQKEPGQSVTSSESVLVLADQLIVQANVDETDLRYVKLAAKVSITLDSMPDKEFPGVVEHIDYEATVINNVTVYGVKIKPVVVPQTFRSGMSATVELVSDKNDAALLLPSEAVITKGNEKFVLVVDLGDNKSHKQRVKVGISDGKNVEIIEGLQEGQKVFVKSTQSAKDGKKNQMRGGIGGIFGK